jgi:hypothetical protein
MFIRCNIEGVCPVKVLVPEEPYGVALIVAYDDKRPYGSRSFVS